MTEQTQTQRVDDYISAYNSVNNSFDENSKRTMRRACAIAVLSVLPLLGITTAQVLNPNPYQNNPSVNQYHAMQRTHESLQSLRRFMATDKIMQRPNLSYESENMKPLLDDAFPGNKQLDSLDGAITQLSEEMRTAEQTPELKPWREYTKQTSQSFDLGAAAFFAGIVASVVYSACSIIGLHLKLIKQKAELKQRYNTQ